jgi:hypothetical protein
LLVAKRGSALREPATSALTAAESTRCSAAGAASTDGTASARPTDLSARARRTTRNGLRTRTHSASAPTGCQPTLRLWERLMSFGSPSAKTVVPRMISLARVVSCEFTPLPR